MASPAVMSTVLQTLPPRPPTPPRETIQDLEVRTGQLNSSSLQPPASSLHTPPSAHSPASGGSTSRRKRVGFSAQAEYQEPPVYPDGETKRVPTPISLPSSVSKPVKSILKITYEPTPLRTISASLEPTGGEVKLGVMLDSTIQQLAGADRDSRLDAYMMLVRALKASNNLPDRVALQEKMSLFMQFMLRDITAKSSPGTIDSPLVNQALGLLITFFHYPAIASTLTNDFAISVVDHCIRSFEDATVPKEVVRHLMQVMAVQNFSIMKVMTLDRVGRLVSAVRKIEDHLKGKSIIMSRVLIYTRLIKQCRHLMAVHSEWLLDLFTDMLSELREIRISAINLGLEAGFTVGKEKNISRKVMELFNQTHEEKRYIEFYQERLRAMVKGKAESAAVPQIWSVIVLFLRCPMDKWDGFSSWLKIIQGCFNGADMRTRIEANVAWSRLGYVMLMDDRSYSKAVPILTQPFLAQLKRKAVPGKHVDDFRDAVVGGVRHLLYYTFKPNANLQLLDSQWDNCVKPLLKQLLDRPAAFTYDGTFHATVILGGLFDCVTPRVWNPERASEKQLIQADELPAIDSKWLRRNAARVFELVEPILLQNFTSLRDTNSPAYKLWRNLVTAVASAASKEIKVSADTAVFVSQAFNTLQKIWKQGPQEEGTDNGAVFLKAIQTYLSVMIESLGLLPFTEKLLSVDNGCNFVPLATPTHRPGKSQGLVKSPLKHMFSILSALPHGIQDDDNFASFFASIFSPFLVAKSDKGRMDLVQELLSTVPMEAMIPYGPWEFTADVVSAWLEGGQSSFQSTSSGGDTPIGHEYRDIVRILERGLRSTPNLPWNHWNSFFLTLSSRVRDETGEAGVAIAVIEPLAKIVFDRCTAGGLPIVPPLMVKCTTELLSVATQPRDRQAVDAARRRLWGAGSWAASLDTFDHLYKSVNLILNFFYIQGTDNEGRVAALLKEVGNFLERCNSQLLTKSLVSLQAGLVPWIGDVLAETHRKPAEVDEAIKSTWQQICNILRGYDGLQQLPLDELEPLLCAAFKSKHRQVVNYSLSLWNSVFEHVQEVRYPEKLKEVLLSLRPFVDIVLPGLDISSIESTGEEPMFVDTQQDDLELPQLQRSKPSSRGTPQPSRSSVGSSSVGLSVPSKRRQDLTPEVRPSKAQRRSATPKLRHDDSQIQFATIESSPVLSAEPESQVLTDRQREVRERQKEVASLFPEIRSSPSRKVRASSRASSRATSPQKLPTLRAATPEPRRTVEEFIASTPTPRRGQVVALQDHDSDMAEPPSSPPEPRRNPLAKEIQSRSATNSLMDEWQFSSSPVSGSPVPAHHEHGIVESSQMDVEEFQLAGEDYPDDDSQADSHDKPELELGESVIMESMVEDSVMIDDEAPAVADSSALDLTASELGVPEVATEAATDVEKKGPSALNATAAVAATVAAAEAPAEVEPEVVPKVTGEVVPAVVAGAVPEVAPELVPEVTPQSAPEPVSEVASEVSATKAVVPDVTVTEDPSTPTHKRTVDHEGPASQSSAAVGTANSGRSSRKRSQKTPQSQIKRTSSRRKSAGTPADESFNGSDIDNSSLVRLVVEIDATKFDPADYEYRQPTESPDMKRLRELTATPKHTRSQDGSNEALDCIVVSSPVKKDDVMVSAPLVEDDETAEQEAVASSQTSSQGRRKRKRGGYRGSQAAAAKRRKSLQGKSQDEPAEKANAEVVDLTELDSQSVASQSLGHSQNTQKTEGSQDDQVDLSAPHAADDVLDDVDLEVQSQIAQEAEAQISQERAESELPVADECMELEPATHVVETRTKETTQAKQSAEMHTALERIEDESEDDHMEIEAATSAAAVEKTATPANESLMEAAPAQGAPETEESRFQKVMSFIKGGIDVLRGAALSRNEVYQLEDAFRDARRELLDAEERGRERVS